MLFLEGTFRFPIQIIRRVKRISVPPEWMLEFD
jgi:hypothetical protein